MGANIEDPLVETLEVEQVLGFLQLLRVVLAGNFALQAQGLRPSVPQPWNLDDRHHLQAALAQ